MLITAQNIHKSFGDRILFTSSSFTVDDKEKIGVVGANGTGKTTLLKMIMGEFPTEQGEINIAKNADIGYLSQLRSTEDRSVYEEILTSRGEIVSMSLRLEELNQSMNLLKGEALNQSISEYSSLSQEFELQGGYSYFSEAKGILKGLGFSEQEWEKKISNLSGGEATRLQLGKLLIGTHNLLILDEPTNHLDMQSIIWLENYLANYKKAVILVSHDRYFMDKIVNKVIEISHQKLASYKGNYTAYSQKQEAIRSAYRKAYQNQQREIKKQEEVIAKLKSFNREKSVKRAESRQNQLDKVERIEKPSEEASIRFFFHTKRLSSKRVLTVNGLGKSFDNQSVFKDVDFEIYRGEKVALIGRNGIGKTTILKIINGIIPEFKGKLTFGENLDIAYFEQNMENMNFSNSIFDEISDSFPEMTNTRIRDALAAFLFKSDDVFQSISDLSGGERGRIALVKLMLSGANFLMLDEPTNHLDIASREILEDAVKEYDGTLFYVSHDRYFINKTADKILELSDNGVTEYLGNYDYYLEKSSQMNQLQLQEKTREEESLEVSGAEDWKKAKQRETEKRKIKNRIAKLEEEIEGLEVRKTEIERLLSLEEIGRDSLKCGELAMEQEKIELRLQDAYEEWENLSLDYTEYLQD